MVLGIVGETSEYCQRDCRFIDSSPYRLRKRKLFYAERSIVNEISSYARFRVYRQRKSNFVNLVYDTPFIVYDKKSRIRYSHLRQLELNSVYDTKKYR